MHSAHRILAMLIVVSSAFVWPKPAAAQDGAAMRAHSLTVDAGGKCRTAAALAGEHSGRLLAGTGLQQTRPVLQAQLVSSSGHFVIHFDTTGANAPAMLDGGGNPIFGTFRAFAESTAATFDHAWDVEIDSLGYGAPPPDGGAGGSDAYDVYLIDEVPGVFGETLFQLPPIVSSPNLKYATWIELDNDFAGLRTPGLPGMRVTVAHELFHAIQAGSYGVWSMSDFYWYELASVWMEDIVFPLVDDYIFDIRGFFTTFRTNAFTTQSSQWPGYERAVFAQYLSKRFDPSIVKRIWERISVEHIVPAIRTALTERGMSMDQAFAEFALWNFYTSDRSDTVVYYSDGKKFPRMSPLATGSAIGMNVNLSFDFGSMSQGQFAFAVSGDTIVSVLARTDDGTVGPLLQRGSVVLSAGDPGFPKQVLSGGWQAGLNVEHPDMWEVEYLSTTTRDPVLRLRSGISPNPWVLSSLRDLTIPVTTAIQDLVSIYLVSPAFDVFKVGDFTAQLEHGIVSIRIPASALSGKIGSGTYTLLVRSSGQEGLLKIAILR